MKLPSHTRTLSMPAKPGGLLGPHRCRLRNFKLLSRLGSLAIPQHMFYFWNMHFKGFLMISCTVLLGQYTRHNEGMLNLGRFSKVISLLGHQITLCCCLVVYLKQEPQYWNLCAMCISEMCCTWRLHSPARQHEVFCISLPFAQLYVVHCKLQITVSCRT
jgi:hypothetical protein